MEDNLETILNITDFSNEFKYEERRDWYDDEPAEQPTAAAGTADLSYLSKLFQPTQLKRWTQI